jgi:hypothetical protein
VRAASEHFAHEVDKNRLDPHPVQTHADAKRAARIEADQRCRLAALAFDAAAGEFDELRVNK